MKHQQNHLPNPKKYRWLIYSIFMIALHPVTSTPAIAQVELNGFTIDDPLVPESEILRGGPPRDGIPSIDHPNFISSQAAELDSTDKVLGVHLNEVSKAYPINILNYHELVNDQFNGQAVAISFCPLCGTGIAFNAQLPNGESRSFGVSGLLYNSDLLMYDRESQSLWSQIEGKAINGPEKGTILERLPLDHTIWSEWKKNNPKTLVLSEQTGVWRNYDRSPYPNYNQSERTYFPVSSSNDRYHPKTWVVGIEVNEISKAYPFPELAKTSGKITDSVGGETFTITYNHTANRVQVTNSNGKKVPVITAFWFAWMAFHPESEVFQAQDK